METVAIYVRVSTAEQTEGYSIDEQISKLKAYAKIKDWNIYKEYIDPGFSGSNLDRPAIKQLMNDARHNKFNGVLVYKLDRLSRSQKDTLYVIEDVLGSHNIDFVSLNENFDTSTPFGKAMIGILSVFAQLEREQIKERMMMGKVGRAKAGKPMSWTRPPYGYVYKEGEYIVVPEEAYFVRYIYSKYLEGESYTTILTKLNADGHITRDKPWYPRAIKQVLTLKVYCGYNFHAGQYYKGTHEPIITEEMYDAVQQSMALRRKRQIDVYNNPNPYKRKYLTAGLMICGICGSTFHRSHDYRVRKDGTYNRFLYCISHYSNKIFETYKKNPNGCTSKRYNAELIDMAILQEIIKLKTHPELIQDKVENFDETEKMLESRLKVLYNQLDKLAELFLDGDFNLDMLTERKQKILLEIDSIEKQKNILPQPLLPKKDALNIVNTMGDILKLPLEKQKQIVDLLIHKITLYPDKMVIKWNFEVGK